MSPFFLLGFFRETFLFCDQKRKRKKSPLLPIARAWRRTTSAAIPQSGPARVLQSPTGALIAARTLRKRALKNPRADGLAPARGQHSMVGRCEISIFCCGFPFVRRGRRPRRPGAPLKRSLLCRCRGEQCSPVLSCASIKLPGHTVCAPTSLCKIAS